VSAYVALMHAGRRTAWVAVLREALALARLAAHELDLYTESEECDIRNSGEAKTVHAYLVKLVAAVSA